VSARILEGRSDVALIELRLSGNDADIKVDQQTPGLEDALHRLLDELPRAISRNLELQPDLKVFIDDSLYLAKPLSARYWLISTALNDADEIAGDLLSANNRLGRKAVHERSR
jgi:hypothetical protein